MKEMAKPDNRAMASGLIWGVLILPFLCPFLTECLGWPNLVRYLMDLCWCGLLALAVREQGGLGEGAFLGKWIAGFLGYAVIGYVFLFQSPFYFLWGLRNNFRFYGFFLAVVCLGKRKSSQQYFRCLDWLFWVNAAVTLVQFFLMDHKGDFLGGLFGVQKGVNGYTNIFLVVCLAKTVLWYFSGEEHALPAFGKVGMCVLIAALTELKFFFIEAVVILGLCAVFTGFSWKKVILVLFSLLTLGIGMLLLLKYFPEFVWFLDIRKVWEAAATDRGYSLVGDLNRLNAISRISREIMTSPWDRLFGFGLGNCDTAAYGFLQTPFSSRYEHLHYSWLSTAMIYLEMGWTGMIFFFGFFILVFWKANSLRRQGGSSAPCCQLAMVTALLCCLIGIYNASLRTEAGYLAYLVLAMPFVAEKPQH